MSNSKISALTSATTPLAGTEVLPIVQSNTTKQVAISDVTAGRAVSGASFAVTGSALPTTGIYAPSANTLGFAGGSTIRGVIYSVGFSVGNISTISDFSGSVMQVYADSGSAARIKLVTATSGTTSSDGASITFDTSNNLTLLNREAGDIVFGTSAVETARLSNSTSNLTLSSGNLVPATAAKGINFTANTPAAGMTSQLLNWYEEGTWTPVLTFNGNSVGITYTTQRGRYARVGRTVTVNFEILLSSKGSSTGEAWITGLPFSAAYLNSMSVYLYSGFSSTYKAGIAYISNNVIYELAANGTAAFTDAQFTNTSRFWATCTYQV